MKRRIVIFIVSLFLILPGAVFAQRTTGGRSAPTYSISISANVRASITITNLSNNSTVSGTTSFSQTLTQGNYSVQASASGYVSQTQTVNLNSAKTINFTLQPSTARLNVTSNVNGATIRISGSSNASGSAPYQVDLPLGNYTVSISAGGYVSQSRSVNLRSAENIHFDLQPAMGTVQVIISPAILNKKVVNARSQIQIYDNGSLLSGTSFQMRPGQHTIQIVSGGFMAQTTINVAAGVIYTINPQLTLSVE